MGTISFGQSAAKGCIQSPGRQKGKRPGTYDVEFQWLVQRKEFPGLGLGDFPTHPILWFDDPSRMGEPPLWWKLEFLKHYLSCTMHWTQSGGGEYTASVEHVGPGFVPTMSNYPDQIHGRDPATITGTALGYTFNPRLNEDYLGDVNQTYDWRQYTESRTFSDPLVGPNQSATSNWGTELTFASQYAIAKARILERTFPAFPGQLDPFIHIERFLEYPYAVAAGDPGAYDMSPQYVADTDGNGFGGPVPDYYPPGPGSPYGDQSGMRLQSYWFYSRQDRTGAVPSDINRPPSFATINVKAIEALRCRFRVSKSLHYFIAEAKITDWGDLPNTFKPNLNRLSDISLLSQGIAQKNQIIEIHLPQGDDFEVYQMADGTDSLSYGRTRFAILNEPPAAWAARTGFSFS